MPHGPDKMGGGVFPKLRVTMIMFRQAGILSYRKNSTYFLASHDLHLEFLVEILALLLIPLHLFLGLAHLFLQHVQQRTLLYSGHGEFAARGEHTTNEQDDRKTAHLRHRPRVPDREETCKRRHVNYAFGSRYEVGVVFSRCPGKSDGRRGSG